MFWPSLILLPFLQASLVLSHPHPHGAHHRRALQARGSPTVQIDRATITGTTNGTVDSFLGIPFAEPPIGDLRLQFAKMLSSYNGTVDATNFGNQCLQQSLTVPPNLPAELTQGLAPFVTLFATNPSVPHDEDCLNLNIVRPSNSSPHSKLPVLVYIYGGGFAGGSNAMPSYNGPAIVQDSINIGQPIIYVSINYRLNVFGFLGGKEVQEAGLGNIGLQDQRTALRWVNKYISAFGGDPTKVTIWGESSGSVSVAMQMFTNNGNTEGLFRAAILDSGSLQPTGYITEAPVQANYDFIVDQVGCSGASDTLACLRTVSADSIVAAVNLTPNVVGYPGLANPYAPRADGSFIPVPPLQLPQHGKMADIPFIIGNDKDQGTLWSIGSLNITTDSEFVNYAIQTWFHGATAADLKEVLTLYPSTPAAGSPFDTGNANAFTPEYKRISAVQGDLFFYAPGRVLLDKYSSIQPAYNYLYARGPVPGLGVGHGTELFNVYGPGDMTPYVVRFVANLNPNGGKGVQWPRYNTQTRSTLQFTNSSSVPIDITSDSQRLDGTNALSALSLKFPF